MNEIGGVTRAMQADKRPDLCYGLDVPHVRGMHPDQCSGCAVSSPQYRKQRSNEPPDTAMYFIVVDEGWRTWILCTGMYEWAADQLLEVLRASTVRWQR